jgi:hypothetical protein
MLTWLSWSACVGPKVVVIPADRAETFVTAGKPFVPPVNGVFMSDAQYQHYRQLLADAIQAEQTSAGKGK